eukprot:scaffold4896_cov84-Isochrysis_galbana.AAC.3
MKTRPPPCVRFRFGRICPRPKLERLQAGKLGGEVGDGGPVEKGGSSGGRDSGWWAQPVWGGARFLLVSAGWGVQGIAG